LYDWKGGGRLFPEGAASTGLPLWLQRYAALPFAVPWGARRCRVFFSGRDTKNRSHVGACTVDLDALSVLSGSVTAKPLLSPGAPGAFDENGCSVSCVVRQAGRDHLYYTGWSLGGTVPFTLAIGLAISDDHGQSFERVSPGPLMGRHRLDPYLSASPSILVEGGLWRMWYVSGVSWTRVRDRWRHAYHIKYAESSDGIDWRRDGRVCIDFAHPGEHAIGRPHVIKDGGVYRMWYCWRGGAYRIGYAESADGLVWRRLDDEPGIAPPSSDWDGEMQAYPMVLRDMDRLVLFYNGNGYGATGFGCAIAREC
jgi:hypothetical protein